MYINRKFKFYVQIDTMSDADIRVLEAETEGLLEEVLGS